MAASYRFAREMRGRRAPLWPAVRRELRWAKGLCMMAFRNLSAPWHPEVIAVDASWWGGGAVSARLSPEQVRELGRYNERWRFSREDEERLAPRTSSLSSMSPEPLDLAESRPSQQILRVPPVPREVWARDWSRVGSYRWARKESQAVLEGRALVWAVKHKLRAGHAFWARYVVLGDAMGRALACAKGRSSAPGMLRVTRQVGAMLLAAGAYLYFRLLPSEANPSDSASRGRAGERAEALAVEDSVGPADVAADEPWRPAPVAPSVARVEARRLAGYFDGRTPEARVEDVEGKAGGGAPAPLRRRDRPRRGRQELPRAPQRVGGHGEEIPHRVSRLPGLVRLTGARDDAAEPRGQRRRDVVPRAVPRGRTRPCRQHPAGGADVLPRRPLEEGEPAAEDLRVPPRVGPVEPGVPTPAAPVPSALASGGGDDLPGVSGHGSGVGSDFRALPAAQRHDDVALLRLGSPFAANGGAQEGSGPSSCTLRRRASRPRKTSSTRVWWWTTQSSVG